MRLEVPKQHCGVSKASDCLGFSSSANRISSEPYDCSDGKSVSDGDKIRGRTMIAKGIGGREAKNSWH